MLKSLRARRSQKNFLLATFAFLTRRPFFSHLSFFSIFAVVFASIKMFFICQQEQGGPGFFSRGARPPFAPTTLWGSNKSRGARTLAGGPGPPAKRLCETINDYCQRTTKKCCEKEYSFYFVLLLEV